MMKRHICQDFWSCGACGGWVCPVCLPHHHCEHAS